MSEQANRPTILIVEDEPIIAMMIEDYLDELGYAVAGSADTVAAALALVAESGCDAAILDVHLSGGEPAWPVADALLAADIPFVLATGGQTTPPPAAHAEAPALSKPYTIDALGAALDALLARA